MMSHIGWCKRALCLCLLFLAWFATGTGNCNAEDATYQTLMRFAGNIHQYNQICPQEKVFLQFDNTAYYQGETIWFKAFVVKSSTLQRAPSKVLYVDLLSADGTILQQHKLKIISGQADGCFRLLDGSTEQARQLRGIQPYPSGYYEIRAYTQFMMNFNQEAAFSRILPVYKAPLIPGSYNHILSEQVNVDAKIRPSVPKAKEVNVSLYPEGGHYVKGLPCNFAFKATGQNGMAVNGDLIISTDKDETQIHTFHDGMGKFQLSAEKANPHLAFRTDDGEIHKVSFPSPERRGYTMITGCLRDTLLHVSLHRNDNVDKLLGVTVTCRGELIGFQVLHINEGYHIETDVSTALWPTGVCRITVFNNKGKVLCSRSLFHKNASFSILKISVTPPSTSVDPYEKIKLGFQIRDHKGNAFKDRFCLSVRDGQDSGLIYSDNLATDLLLSSDLKGLINNPEYYFESDDEEHMQALDLLTLVQGWERYDWEMMTGNEEYVEKRRLEDSLSLNGWILSNDLRKEKYLKDINVYVAVTPRQDKTVELGKYTTEGVGYFGFNLKDFHGLADLTMRVSPKNLNARPPKAKIRLERALIPKPRMIESAELVAGAPKTSQIPGKQVDN